MKNETNIREIALDALLAIEKELDFSNRILKASLDKHDFLERNEKAFIKRLVEGSLERRIYLDYVLNTYSNTKVNKMKPLIRVLLRMSVYQILFMDQVPDSAACNEAVKLAGKRKFVNLKGFVNGVLRKICKSKENLPMPSEENMVQYLSVVFSMPEWIVEHFLFELGEEKTKNLLWQLQEVSPVSIRFQSKCEEAEMLELLEQMKDKGIEVEANPYVKKAYFLHKLDGMQQVPGFVEGKITVQDSSSMLAVLCAGISKGQKVLDVCAAPGGKTLYAAELVGQQGQVIARDLTEHKIQMLEDNLQRMNLTQVQTQIHDATVLDPSLVETADVILADLPCSGLGIMGKKRDIKYHITKEACEELVQLQKAILETVVNYAKPGAVLLFSTCTINQSENQENRNFILEHLGLEAESLDDYLPDELKSETTSKGYLQLIPGIHNTDGFFISRFRKKEK